MEEEAIKNQPLLLSKFPKGFYFGTATSSYQVEGAIHEDGRSASIWDTFCSKIGTIADGSSGAIACDHYHFWEEDIKWMKALHINSYRFSIAWPRIFPTKKGPINRKGLAFYERLIDTLLKNHIEPFPTLYHWDLPQYLQEEGGWAFRETAHYFADYAAAVYDHFKDRVTHWTTLNEPYVSAFMGYWSGVHAPGIRSSSQALSAVHHLLLAHGLAAKKIRELNRGGSLKIGIALNLSPAFPASPEDAPAADWYDILHNKLFLDPLFGKGYPKQFLNTIAEEDFFIEISPGDLEIIATPLDFLGINYYTRGVITADSTNSLFRCRISPWEPNPYSDMWDFYPEGLYELLERINQVYAPKELMVLENGTSLPDKEDDKMRIEYLKAHIEQVAKALQNNIPVKGYFVWSLLDNFEWSLGYTKRFGLLYVDFKTLERHPKKSAHWYAAFLRARGQH